MGIIQKQSIRSSIYIVIGFAIGAFNTLVLFPRFLTKTEFGTTRAMLDVSVTLFTLSSLGSIPVIYKFFPFYNHYLKGKKNDLPMVTGLACLLGFTIIAAFGFFFDDFIIRKLGKSPEFAAYFYTVYPFTFLLLAFTWLEAFAWGLKKTVLTNFLREAGVRILAGVLIVLYALHVISIKSFIHLFSLQYLLPVIILMVVLLRTGNWQFSFSQISTVTRRLKKRMLSFGLFIFGSQFLNILAKTNDSILILGLLGVAAMAPYAIAIYMVTIMEIPQRSMNAISVPVLAESWKNKDMANIEYIYKKSVANLLVIALGLYGLIILNIHNLTTFLGEGYSEVASIVLIAGAAKVLDLGTGINGTIIGTSNFWKFDFYTNVFYNIISIPLNFFLIKSFGIVGPAIAILISNTLYNGVRSVFLYSKFRLQPYSLKNGLALVIALTSYLVIYFVPRLDDIYLDGFIRCLLFILLFFIPAYFTKVAPDLNGIVENALRRFRRNS
ncbi:MAG: polysaccharide biosynthesis protein [Chitinophagaceae bacterium]|nr:polysaccharide biosynthesis protein [Chitinophagaceae bacterium]